MSPFVPILLSAAAIGADPQTSPIRAVPAAAVESTSGAASTVELTLADAFAMLRSGNPRTEAARAPIEAAQADLVAAGVAPNPSLNYEGTRLQSGTNTGAAAADTWTIEWPVLPFGQRSARRAAAAVAVRASQARVAAAFALRARDLRRSFDDLLVQQERVRALEEARADLERVATVVSGRRNAGEASDYDALRVETEFRAMDALLGDARGDLADAQGRVAQMLGRPGLVPKAVGALDPARVDPLDAEALWPEASAALPELVAAHRDEEAARAAERAARRDRWPTPALTGGLENTRDATSRSALFGISIALPVLDRNQGAVARARAAEDAAVLEGKALEAELRADLERAVRVAVERRAAVAELESGVASKLPAMRAMAESAYREGRGGILELLDAMRSMTATRLARLDALQAMAYADTDLLYLLGRADRVGP